MYAEDIELFVLMAIPAKDHHNESSISILSHHLQFPMAHSMPVGLPSLHLSTFYLVVLILHFQHCSQYTKHLCFAQVQTILVLALALSSKPSNQGSPTNLLAPHSVHL